MGEVHQFRLRPRRAILIERSPFGGDDWVARFAGDRWTQHFRTEYGSFRRVFDFVKSDPTVRRGLPVLVQSSAEGDAAA
jgi:hypothetical protein